MLWYLIAFLLFALPALAVVLFIVSLVRYLRARLENWMAPGAFSKEELKKRRIALIVFSCIVGFFVLVFAGLIALLALAMMGM